MVKLGHYHDFDSLALRIPLVASLLTMSQTVKTILIAVVAFSWVISVAP